MTILIGAGVGFAIGLTFRVACFIFEEANVPPEIKQAEHELYLRVRKAIDNG